MKRIYASATYVIAWLHKVEDSKMVQIVREHLTEVAAEESKSAVDGTAASIEDLHVRTVLSTAFGFISLIAKELPASVHDDSGNVVNIPEQVQKWHAEFMSEKFFLAWAAVMEFLNHPYWTRLWIFQEFVLPKDMYFRTSNAEFVWADFNRVFDAVSAAHWERHFTKDSVEYQFRQGLASTIFSSRAACHQFHRRHYHRQKSLRRNSEPYEQSLRLLRIADKCFCQDPRDKIYATLGLAGQEFADCVKVDYNCSLSEL